MRYEDDSSIMKAALLRCLILGRDADSSSGDQRLYYVMVLLMTSQGQAIGYERGRDWRCSGERPLVKGPADHGTDRLAGHVAHMMDQATEAR